MNSIVYALQSMLFVTTAYPYGAIWFLVWAAALVFYLFKKSPVIEKRRKKLFWIFLACVPLFLVVISVSKIKSEHEFRVACHENFGLFVYQQVKLGPEYWLTIDPEVGPVNTASAYVLSSTIELNSPVFDRDFSFKLDVRPLKSGVTRYSNALRDIRSDKVLSEFNDYSSHLNYFLAQKNRLCRTVLEKNVQPHNIRLELIVNTFTIVQ